MTSCHAEHSLLAGAYFSTPAGVTGSPCPDFRILCRINSNNKRYRNDSDAESESASDPDGSVHLLNKRRCYLEPCDRAAAQAAAEDSCAWIRDQFDISCRACDSKTEDNAPDAISEDAPLRRLWGTAGGSGYGAYLGERDSGAESMQDAQVWKPLQKLRDLCLIIVIYHPMRDHF